ncbi:MAG: hypothetical protein ACI4JS_06500 [Oscillospiraceae bacterium]
MLEYEDIIDLLYLPEIDKHIPEGMGYSIPILGRIGTDIIDNFYIFSRSPDGTSCSLPTAKFGVNAQSGTLQYFEELAPDTIQDVRCDSDGMIQLTPLTQNPDIAECVSYMEEFYGVVREFVFDDNLTSVQTEALTVYIKALLACIEPELQPVYFALSPEFFKWALKVLD